MATITVWTVTEFYAAAVKAAEGDEDWFASVVALCQKAHARGDGVAVYENVDLGHPDIGQWQVVTYGGSESQLETRTGTYGGSRPSCVTGSDELPLTLPDIGGRINWRYTLKALVPAPGAAEA